jgi:hypothetical protein
MRTGSWIRQQRDRPIAEHERHAAFTVTAAVAVTATLLLAITAPHAPSPHAAPDPRDARPQPAPQAPSGSGVSVALTGEAERAARVFLHGYLGYIYGHSRGTAVKGATSTLTHALAGSTRRVSPGMRARRPRVVALHTGNAPAGLIRVTAAINDGGLVEYPIALLLARHGTGLLVTGLGGA